MSFLSRKIQQKQDSPFSQKGRNPLYSTHSHAELRAVVKAKGRVKKSSLKGHTAYITRIDRSGNTTMARPCTNCMTLLSYVGITDIFYTDWDGKIQSVEEETEEGEDPLL